MRQGKLILLTGFFGAGKTTLAEDACRNVPNLTYYTTVTTRSPRNYDTTFPNEYQFVNEETYNILRKKSANWDHGEMKGYYYGQNIEAAQKDLQVGKNLLRCVLADSQVIQRIAQHFPGQVILLWIDTPLEVANARLSLLNDILRTERVEGPLQTEVNRSKVKLLSDYVFKPVGAIEQDKKIFRELLLHVLRENE